MTKQQKASYEFGPFRLDAAERRLLRNGEPVGLAPKVFDTLLAMIESSGLLVEKDELMARLWPDTFVEEATLARNISDLRKVLGESSGEARYIETVPKSGYRFLAEVRLVHSPDSTIIVERRTRSRVVVEEELEPGVRSIAVLPFKSLNANDADDYLALGLADALITRLSNIRQIAVRPTSAVMKYVGTRHDPAAAGRDLGVEAVLDGAIQRCGERIRVTVQLVSAGSENPLWAAQFDERFTDVFAVEDSISAQVALALTLKLTGEEVKLLGKRYTDNSDAYELQLKGRYYWNKRSEEALHKAVDCFDQAVEIDPNYALAYAGLSDCYTKLGDVGVTAIPPREAFARARRAALTALKIDSSLVEVHASLGHLEMHHLRWVDAEREFKRAIELNPNYAPAHQWYAYFMAFHRRFNEALEKIEVARKLDSLSLPIIDSVGEFLYFARRDDEAIEQFHKALDMDPNFLPSRIHLGRAYEQAAMFSEAEAQFINARQITGESIDALAALGHTYAMSANPGAALDVLAQLTELSNQRYVSPYDVALIHAALSEIDEAFRWLEKGYDERVEWMIYANVDPRLDPLRADARFSDLIGRLGFAPEKRDR
jgi:TolB-like protein/Flp pilus assembly protein TadD